MKILLDTNILTRSGQPAHAQHHAAVGSVALLLSQHHELCLVPQIFYEFWAVATRPLSDNGLNMPTQEADEKLRQLEATFEVLTDLPTIFDVWRKLVLQHDVKGKSSHDARIVAAMNVHGLTTLLTFNQSDFLRYPGIEVLAPERLIPE